MRSTTARGYDYRHKQARKTWAQRIAAGVIVGCSRCGQPVLPGVAWDLDHTDDRTGYLGPAHASCNRVAGARKGAARRWGRVDRARRDDPADW